MKRIATLRPRSDSKEHDLSIRIEKEVVKDIDLLDPESEDETFVIYSTAKKQATHNIYLSENVENNFAYTELLHKLRGFGKNDTVKLFLANYGGRCSTGFQLFNAFKECAAGVDVIVDAPCYSMGAILALAGNSLTLKPGSFLMFHNYSAVDVGKGTELLTAVTHYHSYFHRHLERVCSPFLTDKELALLRNDNDVYVSYDDKDLNKRIKRHFK